MKPLASLIASHASLCPDGIAFHGDSSAMNWRSYHERSNRLATALASLDLAPGDRVAVVLPDGPGVHAAFVGVEKAGFITMGIGPRAGRAELVHLLRRSGARALVSRANYRDLDMARFVSQAAAEGLALEHHILIEAELEDAELIRVDTTPAPQKRTPLTANSRAVDEPFLLNSTSGTTGMPKCVTHDQARWMHFHELACEAGGFTSDDVFMSVIPAPFGFGLWTAHFSPTLLRAPCVVTANFSADSMIEAIERHRVTVLAAVSTQFVMMLDSPLLERCDLSSLRVLFTGGEAVPYQRAAEFEERTGASVLQFYGSNETGALSRTSLSDPREKRLRTAGRLIDSMNVKLLDDGGNDTTATGHGQPACKGPLLSRGYWNDDDANAALYTPDGWMRTGDVATLDADGFLSIIGRAGDFIIRGGKNISAPAVEQAVATHPSVHLAAVVAMPDPVFGEKVCSYIELRAGAQLTLDDLLRHLRSQDVSKENFPERLVIVDEIPRSSGGKVAKAALREDIRARLRDEGIAER
ncbi:MAG: class I adenylate-forming enzyme family protein [Myxococcota bacterium]|nr:class I adenylate-forming enzyme family protein [Myxococcota bacterium]